MNCVLESLLYHSFDPQMKVRDRALEPVPYASRGTAEVEIHEGLCKDPV